ncbi:MAG TPA: hypothetical protein VG406_00580 [Isosphaeraceae bacterium]|jgi:hypothetical protein|nr:hypothetical protein [Isosphaeraceae bacterium]
MRGVVVQVGLAFLVGSLVLKAIVDSFGHVGSRVSEAIAAQPLPPVPKRAKAPVYYAPEGDRLTFRRPASGPATAPVAVLDLPEGVRLDAEADRLVIGPRSWTATQGVLLAADGRAGLNLKASPGALDTLPVGSVRGQSR